MGASAVDFMAAGDVAAVLLPFFVQRHTCGEGIHFGSLAVLES